MDKIKFGGKELLVKYSHLRAKSKDKKTVLEKGGVTLARVYIDLPETEYIEGIASCSPLDNFSKKRGRTIALGRLKKELRMNEAKYLKMIGDVGEPKNK